MMVAEKKVRRGNSWSLVSSLCSTSSVFTCHRWVNLIVELYRGQQPLLHKLCVHLSQMGQPLYLYRQSGLSL